MQILKDKGVNDIQLSGEHTLVINDMSVNTGDIVIILTQNGINVEGISNKNDSLEDYFLSLTGGMSNG